MTHEEGGPAHLGQRLPSAFSLQIPFAQDRPFCAGLGWEVQNVAAGARAPDFMPLQV